MTPGHFGLAAGAKKFAPRVPLWALFLSTYLLDVVFVFLLAAGVESITPLDPAHPNAYGELLIHAEYTHSLVGALVISALAGWLASRRWERRGGITIGIVTFSHWILDLLVHRPDLPILPGNIGNLPLLGFGLWEYPRASMALELILILVGATLYLFSVIKLSEENRRRAWTASLATTALLLSLFFANTFGL
ncbi:MAG: permease [Chloroflexi bacterium]|nr:permease [Chloroflexota bacterium]